MATVTSNVVVNGFRGKLGDELVFRTMRGKTFASVPARKPNKQKESNAQRDTRISFRQATEWAQMILLDPQQKEYYRKKAKALKLPNAYTAALTDYMRTPRLKEMNQYEDITTYAVSKQDFDVKQVKIVVDNSNGDSKESRSVVVVPGKSCFFKLTQEERQAGVSVYVSDQAERVTTWKITGD